MQNFGIVHPQMLERLTPLFFASLATFYMPSASVNDAGEETQALTPVVGLTDLPCRIAPKATREAREPQQTYTEATHHIAIAGYFPAITAAMWVAVDGALYHQEGQPEYDGNDKTMRVYARITKP